MKWSLATASALSISLPTAGCDDLLAPGVTVVISGDSFAAGNEGKPAEVLAAG